MKYENMTEYNFLELVHRAVHDLLVSARDSVEEDNEVPKLTEEQLESITFESSFYEHRIKFYPEENREVTITIKAEEEQYDD